MYFFLHEKSKVPVFADQLKEIKCLAEVLYQDSKEGADNTAEARHYEFTAETLSTLLRGQRRLMVMLLIIQILLVGLLLQGIAVS